MSATRLTQVQVDRLLDELRPHVSPVKYTRLRALESSIGADGRIRMATALDLAAPDGDDTTRQDAFRKFRTDLARSASEAGLDLRLVADRRKIRPAGRFCWFEGTTTLDADLSALSGTAALRGPIEAMVPSVGLPVIPDRPLRVYVASAPRAGEEAKVRSFVESLSDTLAIDAHRRFQLTSSLDVPIGVEAGLWRAERCKDADIRVVLVSAKFFSREEPGRAETLADPARIVATALGPLDEQADLGGLRHHDILNRHTPLSTLTQESQRSTYCACVVDEIRRLADRLEQRSWDPPLAATMPDTLAVDDEAMTRLTRTALGDAVTEQASRYVDSRAHVTALTASSLTRGADLPGQRDAVVAVDHLATWAMDSNGPSHCALLGDVGMGKTTTTKLLTKRLLQLRETDPNVPLPLLFDLRDLRPTDIAAELTLTNILSGLLSSSPATSRRPHVNDVIARIRRGGCLVIFDGLDEVLVHLSLADQQAFTRQLWRATEAQPAGPASKLLLSCRTHFFRTIRDETTHFTGQDRDGPRASEYLALLMLPFDEDQIRTYLQANLGVTPERVTEFIDMLAGIHNLMELAQRPLTLRLLADQLEFIEAAKLHGRTVRAIALYDDLVQRWLSRDTGKHSLLPEHKVLLMEHLAAQLWRERQSSWTPSHVEQWMLEFLAGRPTLMIHYGSQAPSPEQWKSDLRTATFIARRNDDTFGFAHRSLGEYFVARYLCRTLLDGGAPAAAAWALPVPSDETLDFLGQALDELRAEDRDTCLATLRTLITNPNGASTLLAVAYVLHAARTSQPTCSLVSADLTGADLTGWRFGHEIAPTTVRLSMRGARFDRAVLRRARFDHVDLTDARFTSSDLTTAEFHDCILESAHCDEASLVGTILRSCRTADLTTRGASLYRPQALRCTGGIDPDHWLVAPSALDAATAAGMPSLTSLTGHTGMVSSVGFSPDGTRIVSGGTDGTVRVWDSATGDPVHTLTGHTHSVSSVGFSPDGTRIVSGGGDDGTVRVWDATTGKPTAWRIEHLPSGELARWDAASGQLLGATAGAWRWLGYPVVVDGRASRLPAETLGPLPPLVPVPRRSRVLADA